MLLNLLNSAPKRFVELGEVSLYALIGFAVVVVGIAFLIFIVWAVGKALDKNNQESKPDVQKTAKKQESVKATEAKTAAPLQVSADATEELNEETVAVIMAAIMAYYEKNNPKCEFTVKRIKRI